MGDDENSPADSREKETVLSLPPWPVEWPAIVHHVGYQPVEAATSALSASSPVEAARVRARTWPTSLSSPNATPQTIASSGVVTHGKARFCTTSPIEFDLSEGEIARLHGPVGLYIGSKTPPEIAVAILAEMTAVRHGVSEPSWAAKPAARFDASACEVTPQKV